MPYDTMTADEQMAHCADAYCCREKEIYFYDLNIANYQSMLDAMSKSGVPTDWPDRLRQFRGMAEQQAVDVVPDEDLEQVTQLIHQDRIRRLLKTERIERAKSNLVLGSLRQQIPADKFTEAITAAKARMTP